MRKRAKKKTKRVERERTVSMRKRAKKKTKTEEENQFQRLPDDMVLNVFDKVSDIKWLCRSFVVCKRFSSLIPLVQTLSIKANAGNYLSVPRDDPLNLCGHNIFARLTQVRSLNLDLASDYDADSDSVFKWGAKLTSDHLGSLTFLYATSLSKKMGSEQQDEEVETGNEITQGEQFRRLFLAIDCAKEAMLRLRILYRVTLKYPMLERVTLTDSMNKGVRFCLVGEKLVEWRNTFRNAIKCAKEAVPRTKLENVLRVGSVPVLRLPLSGYVMKGVTIVYYKWSSIGDDSESDAQLAMVDSFAEEQGVFSEAVVQILKNHKDGIKMFVSALI